MKYLLFFIAFAAALTFAQMDRTTRTQAETESHRARIDQAIQANDYAAWKAEHEAWNPQGSCLAGKITEANFATFAQMRQAMRSGDMAKAAELRDKLGIVCGGRGNYSGMGHGHGMGLGRGRGCN